MTDSTSENSDKIFESFLEETLTNQRPPDLTELIQRRFREEVSQGRVAVVNSPVDPFAKSVSAMPRLSNASDYPSPTRSLPKTNRTALVTTCAMAAALLLALTAWQFLPLNWPDQDLAQQGTNTSASQPALHDSVTAATANANANANASASADRSLAGAPARSTPAQPNSHSVDRPRESVDLNKLPFDSNGPQTLILPGLAAISAPPVEPWSDAEVIAWIDGRFEELWEGQGIEPIKTVSSEVLQSRLAWVLTGTANPEPAKSAREAAGQLLKSSRFAEHWADRAVDYWLRGLANSQTPGANKSQEAARAALRSSVAQQIVAGNPWNGVLAELIGSPAEKPEAAFLSSLAGSGNHRLVNRIGSVVLNESLACARCHDASENGRVISTDQDQYWSLVAMLAGIDVKSDDADGRRQLVDSQHSLFVNGKSPNIFFERLDGRLQAALFRLPQGANWRTLESDDVKTPRASLAHWIATTGVSDEASVNLAWRLVFGRPLVAQHAAIDGDGRLERHGILQTLAAQFEAHDRDMAKLVNWIVASRPFATESLEVDRQKWLLANQQQIALWNITDANFATFPRRAESQGRIASLETAVASALRWSSTSDDSRATLAQPAFTVNANDKNLNKDPNKTQIGIVPAAATQYDEPTSSYLVRSLQPSAAQTEFIQRLVASRLTWPEQVSHIAGLTNESSGSVALQPTADLLLKSKSGDRAAALFQLLQCVMLYEESN